MSTIVLDSITTLVSDMVTLLSSAPILPFVGVFLAGFVIKLLFNITHLFVKVGE